MSNPNDLQRTIEEIEALYQLENNIKDLYVEGESDKYFLEWQLKQMGVTNLNINMISSIFIPSEYLLKKNYENNNRDRILFLIDRLNGNKNIAKYKGIIDKDILSYTRGLPNIDNILTTDYSCVEMYAYNDDVITKINDTGFSHKIKNNLFLLINEILKYSSSVRILEKRTNILINKLSFDRYIECENKFLEFKKQKYLKAIHNSNSTGFSYDDFLKIFSTIFDELSNNDVRNYSNGHDFISILKCTLKKMNIIDNNVTDKAVRAIVMVAIDTNYLLTCDLFKELINFYKE